MPGFLWGDERLLIKERLRFDDLFERWEPRRDLSTPGRHSLVACSACCGEKCPSTRTPITLAELSCSTGLLSLLTTARIGLETGSKEPPVIEMLS